MTPAQIVAMRFPAAWTAAPTPPPAARAVASDGERQRVASLMFNPFPTYSLASTTSEPSDLPAQALAYADPVAPTAGDRPVARPVEKRATPAPRPAKPSNNVLNDAQIASIKTRLKLTPSQERMWPAVESALRHIAYKKDGAPKSGANGNAGRMATIDPNSPAVQQLKSAAIPLIMNLNAEQKDEVRTLAYVMGLESLAAQF